MSATIESQKLVTEATYELLEFDFSTVGSSAHVYLANAHNEASFNVFTNPYLTWIDGNPHTFYRLDFQISGISCDLTGSVPEPTLKLAADSLWSLSEWASATTGFGLMDYRGLRVRRQRLFFNTNNYITPQTFYVKSVDELNASTISFTLTPSLGSERLDRPSARKLEI